jgi:hypothetical protein
MGGELHGRLRQRGGSGEHHLHLDGGYGEAGDRDDGYERQSWLQPDGRGAGIHGHRQLRGHDHAESVTTSGPSNTGCAYTQTWEAN